MGHLYSTPIGRQPGSLYGHHLPKSFKAQGISEQNANYIINNRSPAFQKAASTQIKKWQVFCLVRDADPSKPSLNDLADYVRFLDREMKTARSIRTYFGAIENCLDIPCKQFMSHSSIQALLTIVAHNKPTIPVLPGEIWDADRVILHFIDMPENTSLTNLQLSKKCIVLLMLASGRRKGDIMALDVSGNL